MSPAEIAAITADEFLVMPESEGTELVDGQIQEKNMGSESNWIGTTLSRIVGNYADSGQLGWVFGSEGGLQCFSDDADRVRKPDVFFVCAGRLPGERIPRGWLRIAPDIVAEVVSPNDKYEEVEQKVEEYLGAGVKLVWVVNPDTRIVMVYRPKGASPSRLRADGVLSGEDVLPGFECKVADLFPARS